MSIQDVLKHLPGKHSQRTHDPHKGGGGGSSTIQPHTRIAPEGSKGELGSYTKHADGTYSKENSEGRVIIKFQERPQYGRKSTLDSADINLYPKYAKSGVNLNKPSKAYTVYAQPGTRLNRDEVAAQADYVLNTIYTTYRD